MLFVPPWQADTTDCPDLAEHPEPHGRALMEKGGGSDEFFLQTGRAHVTEWVSFGERACYLNSSTCFLASPLENQVDGVLPMGKQFYL